MSRCNWVLAEVEPDGVKRFTCACGNTVRTRSEVPPKGQCRTKPVKRDQCAHQGEELRIETCKRCGNREQWKIKVFRCAVHGECTVAKQVPGVACCGGCPNYEASSRPPS